MATTTVVNVQGMTCDHCVASVTGELSKLPSVTGVGVDLEQGTVEITSDGPIPAPEIARAIEEAGYEVSP